MYEDAHLEAYYESRQHGDLDHDSFEDDWDLEGFDDEDDCPYCEIHKEEHELGGYICELTQGLRNMGWHRMSTWDGIE